jgi:hypothetical protein
LAGLQVLVVKRVKLEEESEVVEFREGDVYHHGS